MRIRKHSANTSRSHERNDVDKFTYVAKFIMFNMSLLVAAFVSLVIMEIFRIEGNTMYVGPLIKIVVPVTHFYGGYILFKKDWAVWQPFQGGTRFVVLQACAWLLFAIAVLVSWIPFIFTSLPPHAVMLSATTLALMSEILVVASLMMFKRSADSAVMAEAWHPVWFSFIVTNIVVGVLSACLAYLAENTFQNHIPTRVGFHLLSAASLVLTVPLMHGMGGIVKWRTWAFFQPFVGGPLFVGLQCIAWIFFSSSLLISIILLTRFMFPFAKSAFALLLHQSPDLRGLFSHLGLVHVAASASLPQVEADLSSDFLDTLFSHRDFEEAWNSMRIPMFAGVTGLVAEIFIAVSLLTFQSPVGVVVAASRCARPPKESGAARLPFLKRVRAAVLYGIFFNLHNIAVGIFVFPYLVWDLQTATAIVVGCVIPYAILTTYGNAVQTGRRRWDSLLRASWIWDDLLVFSNTTIINDAGEKLPEDQNYIFAYHPHAVFPVSAVLGPLSSEWKHKVGQFDITPLTASATLKMPVTRDFSMWVGMREVTRKVFTRCVAQEKLNVLVVPGGQREMLESKIDSSELVVVTRHRGFLRIALQTGTPVVPLLCFGETRMLENVYMPLVQKWSVSTLRVPLPFYPHGQYFLPFPTLGQIGLVVGGPIHPGPAVHEPTEDMLDALHQKYFGEIQRLYYKYRGQFDFGKVELVLLGDEKKKTAARHSRSGLSAAKGRVARPPVSSSESAGAEMSNGNDKEGDDWDLVDNPDGGTAVDEEGTTERRERERARRGPQKSRSHRGKKK